MYMIRDCILEAPASAAGIEIASSGAAPLWVGVLTVTAYSTFVEPAAVSEDGCCGESIHFSRLGETSSAFGLPVQWEERPSPPEQATLNNE
jgi:hypothetical protein